MAQAPQWMSDKEFEEVAQEVAETADVDVLRQASLAILLELNEARKVLRPGVAYMPVPRCDGCAHWNREGVDVGPYGRCLQSGHWASPEFGCVQWEAKP